MCTYFFTKTSYTVLLLVGSSWIYLVLLLSLSSLWFCLSLSLSFFHYYLYFYFVATYPVAHGIWFNVSKATYMSHIHKTYSITQWYHNGNIRMTQGFSLLNLFPGNGFWHRKSYRRWPISKWFAHVVSFNKKLVFHS